MKEYSQGDINEVWQENWKKWREVPAAVLFKNPLFVEGYQVYLRYMPEGALTFLELGAGSGRYGLAIANDYPQCSVVLTDPLQESVANMEYAGKSLGLTNVTYARADMRALPYADNSYDVVFADAVIQHIKDEDLGDALKEAYRVLKPGGTLIVSAVNSWNPFHRTYKEALSFLGKEYEYGYERTYSRSELRTLFEQSEIPLVDQNGFYVAYGLYRFGYTQPLFKVLSRIVNRAVGLLDMLSNRRISKFFGFEIFCVGSKPLT